MRRAIVAAITAGLLLLTLVIPVSAFPLTTCTLSLESRDASGAAIDSARDGDGSASQSDPLRVTWDGSVAWDGSTGSAVITNHSWSVNVFNIPTPLRGSDPNTGGDTTGAGTVDVGRNSPVPRFAGLFYINGSLAGDGGSCAGSGWLLVEGDPVGTIPWIASVVVAAIGALLLLGSLRHRRPIRGLIGGLLVGLGLAALLVQHAQLPFGDWTPIGVILGSAVIGLILGFFGGSERKRPEDRQFA
jgi:hypothetical protein